MYHDGRILTVVIPPCFWSRIDAGMSSYDTAGRITATSAAFLHRRRWMKRVSSCTLQSLITGLMQRKSRLKMMACQPRSRQQSKTFSGPMAHANSLNFYFVCSFAATECKRTNKTSIGVFRHLFLSWTYSPTSTVSWSIVRYTLCQSCFELGQEIKYVKKDKTGLSILEIGYCSQQPDTGSVEV